MGKSILGVEGIISDPDAISLTRIFVTLSDRGIRINTESNLYVERDGFYEGAFNAKIREDVVYGEPVVKYGNKAIIVECLTKQKYYTQYIEYCCFVAYHFLETTKLFDYSDSLIKKYVEASGVTSDDYEPRGLKGTYLSYTVVTSSIDGKPDSVSIERDSLLGFNNTSLPPITDAESAMVAALEYDNRLEQIDSLVGKLCMEHIKPFLKEDTYTGYCEAKKVVRQFYKSARPVNKDGEGDVILLSHDLILADLNRRIKEKKLNISI
jgi:hypothetical protein